jgi:Holliday junction resolvasome RuvABC endonuclease subunit
MTAPVILALDPGHKTGYAVDDPDAANGCRTGILEMPREYPKTGLELCFLERWLLEMIEQFEVTVLAWEAPLVFSKPESATTTSETMEFAFYFGAVCDLVGTRNGIATWKVHAVTARHHFTGSGRAKKDHVYQRAKLNGYQVKSFDASDAVAIWDFIAHKYGHRNLPAGPLFGKSTRSMRRSAPELDDA